MFRSAHDAVVPAVTAAQMREVDRVAVEETGPNLYQMMEHAARSLALTALEMATDDGPIVVLAGTGGNGGGGLAAARHLANRGRDVTVVLADRTALTDVPASSCTPTPRPGAPAPRCPTSPTSRPRSSSTRSSATASAARRAVRPRS
jgi:hypothetical protein